MPLDQYKTQVLLLHSEQTTLDNLSSGFSDNYTVHCATSGSEALNTLVETPINIIVTAQDLPGMSGLDALREAKKRSPDTIGILLAGESGNDVQALVGEEEVFQVVTGSVTSDSLSQLVDNATRQMRLMALAGAANDTVASVDEPAEHIIMETSDNGSTIISSGMTGQVPALDPKKISAAANVGSRSVDILVLTKDQEFLETVKDSSKGMHKVFYANTLAQANDAIAKHKIGVAVVDAAMVGEKIEQLTQHLRKGSPRLVSIVAGRRDDGEMLMDLINRGKVYRFLLKPVSPGRARLAVEASVKHHLEAPDAAFQVAGSKAPAAAPAKSAQPAAKPAAPKKPAPKLAPKATPKPAAKQDKAPVPTANKAAPIPSAPADPPLGSVIEPPIESPIESPIDNGLADAFGQDDSSFTETVTGLISSVAEKFSAKDGHVEKENDVAPIPEPTADRASGSGGSPFTDPKILGIGAGVLVVVAAIGFWFLGGSPEVTAPPEAPLATPKISEADVVFEQEQVAPQINVDVILDEARLARDAGQIFNPVGSNAIELFAEALAADPENATIAAELDAAIIEALGMSETAMLESRLDDADAALQRVASVDPEHARLPFLTAQLSQIQLRGYISDARAAIRETRFEDAANALEIARTVAPADNSEIDAVMEELRAARSEQQVDEVLAMAALRLDSGQLLQPPNDNARYYYQLVLSNDAGNTAARQGLSVISSKLVLQARTAIENGNLNEAEDILADAQQVDPANADVSATLDTLAGIRAANAERERRVEAERLANDAREAAAAEAERIAAAERQAKADRLAAIAQLAEEGTVAGEAPDDANEISTATADRQAEVPVATLSAPATNTPLDVPASSAAAFQPAAGSNEKAAGPEQRNALEPAAEMPVAISSLNRTRYVAPKYPRNAQRRNQSGWVDVVFTVTVDGTVRDVEVRGSEPGEVFVNAAIRAVEKWEFEPVVQYGLVVERRAGVRMMFELE